MKVKNKIIVPILGAAAFALSLAVVGCDGATDNTDPTEPVKYTVTYSTGEGTGTAPASASYEAGEKFDLPQQGQMSKVDSTFDGWSYNSTKYAAGVEFTMPANDVTFTALWKANGTPTDPTDPTDPTVMYSANELDYKGTIVLYTDNTGKLLYGLGSDDREATLTYTIDGTSIKITIGGADFNGTYTVNGADKLLTVNFTYASTSYRFGAFQSEEHTKPTVSFNANGGTGTAPVIGADAITFDDNADMYKFTLPANTYTAPANKKFKCWGVGTESNTYNAGSTYFAQSGEEITLIAIWEDVVVPPVVPTGKEFRGNCELSQELMGGSWPMGGVTVTNIWYNSATKEVFYRTSDNQTFKTTATDYSSHISKPSYYGSDALFYEIMISKKAVNLLVKADFSAVKLYDTSSDVNPIPNGEFFDAALTTFTVTYNVPDGVTGEAPAVQTLPTGSTYTFVDSNTFAKSGYTFFKWKVDRGTGTPSYALSSTWTLNSNITVTPVFKIEFEFGGDPSLASDYGKLILHDDLTFEWGTFSGEEKSATYEFHNGNENIVHATVVYPNEEPDGEDFVYYMNFELDRSVDGKKYILLDDMLSFEFTANDGTTKLTFDGKGGAKLGESEGTYEIQSGGKFTLSIGGNSYTIDLMSDGSGGSEINKKITVNDTTYVFGTEYTVTFTAGEGSGTPHENMTAMKGEEITLPDGTGLSKEGFTFGGWKVNGEGSALRAGAKYQVTADSTLVAYWTEGSVDNSKLYDYAGETSNNAVIYGYSAKADAQAAGDTFDVTTASGSTNSFFKVNVYYNASTSESNPNRFFISIYYSNFGNVTNSNQLNEVINDKNMPNQEITIVTNTTYEYDFTVSFAKKADGTRTITITYNGQSITWEEIKP